MNSLNITPQQSLTTQSLATKYDKNIKTNNKKNSQIINMFYPSKNPTLKINELQNIYNPFRITNKIG